jgi:hypothetical protein
VCDPVSIFYELYHPELRAFLERALVSWSFLLEIFDLY